MIDRWQNAMYFTHYQGDYWNKWSFAVDVTLIEIYTICFLHYSSRWLGEKCLLDSKSRILHLNRRYVQSKSRSLLIFIASWLLPSWLSRSLLAIILFIIIIKPFRHYWISLAYLKQMNKSNVPWFAWVYGKNTKRGFNSFRRWTCNSSMKALRMCATKNEVGVTTCSVVDYEVMSLEIVV